MRTSGNTVALESGPALGDAGPNWEQFRSAQVPSQVCRIGRGDQLGAIGPIGLRPAVTGVFQNKMFSHRT